MTDWPTFSASFWDDTNEHATRVYVGPSPTDALITSVEEELGYRLPAAYVALMRLHNGGLPRAACCPAPTPTTWAGDHVGINAIVGIGRDLDSALAGANGSRFWLREWGYPEIGVYFADCPSAGHDMIAFDYRTCGPTGEPQVVHVDQERDYRITVLAPDFTTFVHLLRPDEDYELDD